MISKLLALFLVINNTPHDNSKKKKINFLLKVKLNLIIIVLFINSRKVKTDFII